MMSWAIPRLALWVSWSLEYPAQLMVKRQRTLHIRTSCLAHSGANEREDGGVFTP